MDKKDMVSSMWILIMAEKGAGNVIKRTVFTGTKNVSKPTLGYDYLLPVSFCHNMAESGAAFGAALRMKDSKAKAAAMTTSVSIINLVSQKF